MAGFLICPCVTPMYEHTWYDLTGCPADFNSGFGSFGRREASEFAPPMLLVISPSLSTIKNVKRLIETRFHDGSYFIPASKFYLIVQLLVLPNNKMLLDRERERV